MACDFCREVERLVDDVTDTTVYVTMGDVLAIDDGGCYTIQIPIRYCPMCGQDLREVINADS